MTTRDPSTPASHGFRMPAEWEAQEAIWLAWPHDIAHWHWTWGLNPKTQAKYDRVIAAYAKGISVLEESEKVCILVNNATMEKAVRAYLRSQKVSEENLQFFHIPTTAPWMRDLGPTFLVRDQNGKHEVAMTDWIFNSWGGKYPPWDDDDKVPDRIASALKMRRFRPEIVLEGGSIEVNGKGTVITTEGCLLNPNRNPNRTREEIEKHVQDFLGVTNVLWMGSGVANDDTDGHIDNLVRFVNPTTVLCAHEENEKDENFQNLHENFERLQSMRDQDGELLEVITLPMPDPQYFDGERYPASYANFLITNKIVLLPSYSKRGDAEAMEILQHYFPRRKIVGVDSTDIIWGQGSFHCLSQQQPA